MYKHTHTVGFFLPQEKLRHAMLLEFLLFEDVDCYLLALDNLFSFYLVNSEYWCNKWSLILYNPSGQCPPIISSFKKMILENGIGEEREKH